MRRLSLGVKTAFVFAIFVFAAIQISYKGISEMAKMNALSKDTAVLTQRVDESVELQGTLRLMALAEKSHIIEETDADKRLHSNEIKVLSDHFDKVLSETARLASATVKPQLSAVRGYFEQWKALDGRVQDASFSEDTRTASRLSHNEGGALRRKIETAFGEIIAINQKSRGENQEKAVEASTRARSNMIWVTFIALVLGVTSGASIYIPLGKSIAEIIRRLNDASLHVSTAAGQIGSSSGDLSRSTTTQSSSIQETASAVTQMTGMVRKTMDNATQAAQLSSESEEAVAKGKKVVEQMIWTIDEINTANEAVVHKVHESNGRIAEIVKVIAEIGDKTKVINEIVFQTKLLSFNASVEAARAGEHGRGFAVVAEEVGNLAQMSGKASLEISTMLEGSIKKVEGIVTETGSTVNALIATGKEKVLKGTKVAVSCGKVFDEITDHVSKVATMANDIAAANSEQFRGIEEVTKAMQALEGATQANGQAARQNNSSALELSGEAEALHSIVEALVRVIRGSRSEGETAAEHGKAAAQVTERIKERAIKSAQAKRSTYIKKQGEHSGKAVATGDLPPSSNDERFKEVS